MARTPDSLELETLINTILSNDPDSINFTHAITSLASLSREQESIRSRLASEEVLHHLLRILSTHPKTVDKEETFATILRCVGNACVSNTEACQDVADFHFGWCKAFLKGFPCQWSAAPTRELVSESLSVSANENGDTEVFEDMPFPMPSVNTRNLAIKVLYNICSQSETAQQQCYHADVHTLVIEAVFDKQHFCSEASVEILSLTVDLLLGITAQHKALTAFEGETDRKRGLGCSNEKKALKTDALYWLVKAPLAYADKLDVDDWASLLETCLVFLRDPRSYDDIIGWELFHVIWFILVHNERKTQAVEESEEDRKLLVALSTSLTWLLSDVAATPAFATAYANAPENILALAAGYEDFPVLRQLVDDLTDLLCNGTSLSHDALGRVREEVIGDKSLHLTTAACQVIGNLLHNIMPVDGTIPEVIHQRQLHKHLLTLMASSNNADFLHSAAGLIKQLSRPSVVAREEIACDDNALPAIKRLGQHTMQELNQDALTLMRALGKDAPAVQERFKELAGEVMATVAETQQAAASAGAQSGQPRLESAS